MKDEVEQPEPEPVVTVYEGAVAKWNLPEKFTGFLYTSPPKRKWQKLTDDDWKHLYDEFAMGQELDEFAEAIEAKLKEKNT